MKFSSKTREETIERLSSEKLDLLIIGGGITGAGLALQAGAKNMKAGLVEMQDFAAGTSSRSTKLVHGGLRYLKQFEVELVAAIAKERAIIHKNAPHIVKPDKMLLPVYHEPEASFNEFSAEIALDLYDKLGGVEGEWRYEIISKDEVLEEHPVLREEGLINGGLYLDYKNDDARLTIEIMKKAHELGTLIANYVRVIDFIYNENNHIIGVEAEDVLTKTTFEIYATVVVNATGHWSDQTRNLQKGRIQGRMYPVKGVHFVVDSSRLPVKRTIYTDTGLGDHRMIFIIPRGKKTYFGTTETPYSGNFVEPTITKDDIDYLLKAVNHRFPSVNLTVDDIETGWSGLRPLILEEGATDASKISRGHDVFVSETGLVTIAGGKLTDYRLMAEDTFMTIEDELKMKTGATYPVGDTENIPLSGGDLPEGMTLEDYVNDNLSKGTAVGLSEEDARALIEWYGTNAGTVFSLKDQVKGDTLPLKVELALLYGLEYESVISPVDFVLRRTDILLFDTQRMAELKQPIVDYMADYLGWSDETKDSWKEKLDETVDHTQLNRFRK